MNLKNTVIFCDFDGTFAEKDIGNCLFTHFSGGKNIDLVKRWKKGEVSSRECLLGEAELVRITTEEMYGFLDQFNLRPGAEKFYYEINDAGVPFYIVSDGNDMYIEYILRRYGLNDITYYSNHGRIENGRMILEFPFDNDGCRRCGTCKGARMARILDKLETRPKAVFIGDGLSDICALPHADLIFARGDLFEYCRNHGYEAIEYRDFFDILKYLEKF